MQQHRQLPRHGDDRSLIGVQSSAAERMLRQISRSSFVIMAPSASGDSGYGRGIRAIMWGTGPRAVARLRFLVEVIRKVISSIFPPKSYWSLLFHSPTVRSRILEPCLLLGNKALNELCAFLLARIDPLVEEHFANLRERPLLVIRDALQLPLELRSDSKS